MKSTSLTRTTKKLIRSALIILCFTLPAHAESMYTVTVNNVSLKQVQDAVIEVFTGKNFNLDDVSDYRIVMTKAFGDGFWVASRKCFVRCNTIARDGNVKMTFTEEEGDNGAYRRRSIDHLIPIINEVKSVLDGTPKNIIKNEAVNQLPGSGNEREKALGIRLAENNKVAEIVAASAAQDKIFPGDLIVEIDGISVENMDTKSLETYISNKWGNSKSLTFTIDHEGKKNIIVLTK
ncbi:MAG: PDZ domain-containing protein [Synergistaceae bacterium]|nr:PDZ domain-containing protein [Candidatus Equadaptatus faecalis]